MSHIFSAPKAPDPIPTPPPPTITDTNRDATQALAQAQAQARGAQSTLLTSGQGTAAPSVARKTLLGQ